MAEEKEGFILYKDLIHTISKMAKTSKGKKQVAELFITILEYVNDKNPLPSDPVVEIVFEPIKQQLKRDLKRWETTRGKRSEAGKISAAKKKQAPTNSTGVESVEQTPTNSTVSVSGNVSVNDTVTVINKNPFDISYPFQSEEFISTWHLWRDHLIGHKKPFNNGSTERIALQEVEKYGEERAIEILKYTMSNNWKNLREPEGKQESKIKTALNVSSQQDQEIAKKYSQ